LVHFIERILSRAGIAGDVLTFFWRRRLWWLVPLVLVLFILSALVLLATVSGIAPFIYPLF
jgi:hypothetical protein